MRMEMSLVDAESLSQTVIYDMIERVLSSCCRLHAQQVVVRIVVVASNESLLQTAIPHELPTGDS